jgi:hypothetical protein
MTSGVSCNSGEESRPEPVVFYYPEKNIYYDSTSSNYYYSLDSAKTWDSMEYRAPGFGAVLGEEITIARTSDTIWSANALHRRNYNGVLLNIINSRTISLSKADRINKLRAVVKVETQAPVKKEDPPPEKGLKKFFKKIFGKKNKAGEEKKE